MHRRPLPLVVGCASRLPGAGLDRVPVAVDLDDGPVRELRRGDLEAVRQVDLGARARVRPDGYAQVSERALLDGIAAQEQRRGEEYDWGGLEGQSPTPSARKIHTRLWIRERTGVSEGACAELRHPVRV